MFHRWVGALGLMVIVSGILFFVFVMKSSSRQSSERKTDLKPFVDYAEIESAARMAQAAQKRLSLGFHIGAVTEEEMATLVSQTKLPELTLYQCQGSDPRHGTASRN